MNKHQWTVTSLRQRANQLTAFSGEIAVKGDYPSQRTMREKLPRSMSLMDPVAHQAWAEELEQWGFRIRRPKRGQC